MRNLSERRNFLRKSRKSNCRVAARHTASLAGPAGRSAACKSGRSCLGALGGDSAAQRGLCRQCECRPARPAQSVRRCALVLGGHSRPLQATRTARWRVSVPLPCHRARGSRTRRAQRATPFSGPRAVRAAHPRRGCESASLTPFLRGLLVQRRRQHPHTAALDPWKRHVYYYTVSEVSPAFAQGWPGLGPSSLQAAGMPSRLGRALGFGPPPDPTGIIISEIRVTGLHLAPACARPDCEARAGRIAGWSGRCFLLPGRTGSDPSLPTPR